MGRAFSADRAYKRPMVLRNDISGLWEATMRHTAWAALVGIIAVQVSAAQPPAAYAPPTGFPVAQPGYAPNGGQHWGNGPVANGGYGAAMNGSCGACRDATGASGRRSGA